MQQICSQTGVEFCRVGPELSQVRIFELTVVDIVIKDRIAKFNLANNRNLNLLLSLVTRNI